jgi:hypothetical protein
LLSIGSEVILAVTGVEGVSIMTTFKLAAAALIAVGISGAAHADNAMQVCGAKYQAAKTAKTLPAGQTWNQFLAQCRTTLPKTAAATAPVKTVAPAPAAAAKPVVAKAAAAPKAARVAGQPSAAQSAMYARERQCGTQWKADKAAGKIPAGQKWPQYWSACNKRMK